MCSFEDKKNLNSLHLNYNLLPIKINYMSLNFIKIPIKFSKLYWNQISKTSKNFDYRNSIKFKLQNHEELLHQILKRRTHEEH